MLPFFVGLAGLTSTITGFIAEVCTDLDPSLSMLLVKLYHLKMKADSSCDVVFSTNIG